MDVWMIVMLCVLGVLLSAIAVLSVSRRAHDALPMSRNALPCQVRGCLRGGVTNARHAAHDAPRAIAPANAPPLPAWATYRPEQEESPLTHEAAWEARLTLRRLDPETAADLDRTVPLEPPPPPPALSVRVEAVNAQRSRVTGEHTHPLRRRLAEIVRDIDVLVTQVHKDQGRREYHLTKTQAAVYTSLVSEGTTLRAALEQEQKAAERAAKMAEQERRREDRVADEKARREQAVANLMRLREIKADTLATNARIGNSPERATTLRRIEAAIEKIEADMTETERATALAFVVESGLAAAIERPTGITYTR